MITRTITTTHGVAMVCDTETATLFDDEFCVIGEYTKNDKKLHKILQSMTDTQRIKVVAVKEVEVSTDLYGMSEDLFIDLAQILPPRKEY